MKYKIGDTVQIRSNLVCNRWYGEDSVITDMMPYLGSTATVVEERTEHGYILDSNDWTWTDEMLEPTSNEQSEIERLKARIVELERRVEETKTPAYEAMVGKLVWAWDIDGRDVRIMKFTGMSEAGEYSFKTDGGWFKYIRPVTEEEVASLIYKQGE